MPPAGRATKGDRRAARAVADGGRRARGGAASFAGLAERALEAVLSFEAPADVALRRFFAEHREMGQRDRAAVAESVFDVLRNRRLYAYLAQAGTGPMMARLLAISQARAGIDPSSLPPEVRYSLPDWLHERLRARLAPEALASLAEALLRPAPLDLRANLLKGDRDAALAQLRAEGIAATPCGIAPLALRIEGRPALERTEAFRSGLVEVQDAGSQLVAHLVAPRRGQTIVDFCAGAGGKTLALAALLRGTGQVFACDVSPARLQRLRPRLARSGATNVQPFGLDSERDPKLARLAGRADAVLVDAPCSGTGTLRRNPDIKWRFREADLAPLIATQRAILAAAARLVRPGGVLVYATCSLLREENEDVRAAFEAEHPGWRAQDAVEVLVRQGARIEPAPGGDALQLWPDRHDTDAFYAVRWVRAE